MQFKQYRLLLLLFGLVTMMPVCGLSILLLRAEPGLRNLALCLAASTTLLVVCVIAYRHLVDTYFAPVDAIASHLHRFMDGEPLPGEAEWLLPQLQSLQDMLADPAGTASADRGENFRNDFSAQAIDACIAITMRVVALTNLLQTDPAGRQEYVDEIRLGAEQVSILLGEVAGKEFNPLRESPVDLLEAVDDTVRLFSALHQSKAPVFVLQPTPGQISVNLDRQLFQALLLNLLWLYRSTTSDAATRLELTASTESFSIDFESEAPGTAQTPTPSARTRQLLAQFGASWEGARLSAAGLHLQQMESPARAHRASVVARSALEKTSIESRLRIAGATIDDTPANADVCVVTIDDDAKIHALQKQVRAFSTLLVVGASSLYALPNVRQLRSPLHQRDLETAIQSLPVRQHAAQLALVVDDNLASLRLASLHLDNLGISSLTAREGATALELVAAHPFSIALLDQHLPDTTGTRLAAKIRTQKPDLKVILMTAAMTADDMAEVTQSGALAVLKKPLNPQALSRLIADAGQPPEVPAQLAQANGQQFDQALSLHRANQQPDLAQELLEELMTTIDAERRELETILKAGDTAAARQLVHRLRGGLAYCGVPRLEQAAELLAEALASRTPTSASNALQHFGAETDALLGWYEPGKIYFGESPGKHPSEA